MQNSTEPQVVVEEPPVEKVENVETVVKEQEKPQLDNKHHQNRRNNKKHRFVYPENWKEEVKAGITLKSEIVQIKKDDLISRPNLKDLRKNLRNLENKIQKKYDILKAARRDIRNMREKIRNENKVIYDQLKELNKEKRGYLGEMGDCKKEKASLLKLMSNCEREFDELSKKCYKGKLWKKEKLMSILEEREENFRNTKKTATEEKSMIAELSQLKKSLKLLPMSEKILNQKFKLRAELKGKGKKSSLVYDKLKKVNDKINKLRDELNKNKAKKEEEEKKESEEKKEEKKVRQKSEAELELEKTIDEALKNISEFKDKKQVYKTKFDEESLSYEKQAFEVKKIEFALKCKQYLQRQEKRVKYEEEKKLQREEEEKLKKDRLKFKYQKEIDLCEALKKEIVDMKIKTKVEKTEEKESEKKTVSKIDDNLEVVMSKRDIYANEEKKIHRGKKNKRQRKKKNREKTQKTEDSKLLMNFYSIQLFDSLKVLPPSTYKNIDEVVTQLEAKRDYYLKRRENEMSNFENIGGKVEEVEENVEEKVVKKVVKKKRNVVVKDNEEEFPGL